MKVSKIHHILAYISAAIAVISVILALVSRLIMQPIGFQQASFMVVATVALLFAIYFLLEGAVHHAKKSE